MRIADLKVYSGSLILL